MPVANQRLKVLEARVRAHVDETLARARLSVKVQKAIFKATATMLKSIGLMGSSSPLLYLPGIALWIIWWVVFAVVALLPTYGSEPFFVFPSVLALVVAWLLGTSLYAQALLSADLSDLRVSPAAWSAFLNAFQSEGIQVPEEMLTVEAAAEAAKELERPLPALVLATLLGVTSVAALQALLGGCLAIVGLLIGPALAGVHWWHGWSPVSILYAASVPTALFLMVYGLLPFMVARLLAALRIVQPSSAGPSPLREPDPPARRRRRKPSS